MRSTANNNDIRLGNLHREITCHFVVEYAWFAVSDKNQLAQIQSANVWNNEVLYELWTTKSPEN